MTILPNIIEQVGRNKKVFSIPDKLFEKSIITLNDEIDDDISYTIITQLLYLDSIDTNEPVTMYINSPGGSVTAGLAIIDTMNAMQRKVNTIGIGSCASMGAMILLCGTGERKALKNARIMLHSISSGTSGVVHNQIIDLEETKLLQKRIMAIIANKSKVSVEDAERMTERDKYMGVDECIKYGFLDSGIKDNQ